MKDEVNNKTVILLARERKWGGRGLKGTWECYCSTARKTKN